MGVAVDLVILLARQADDAGAGLIKAIGIRQSRSEDLCQQDTGLLRQGRPGGCIILGLPDPDPPLTGVSCDPGQDLLIIIEIIRPVGIDLTDQLLHVIGILHGFSAQDTEALDHGIHIPAFLPGQQGPGHGLAGEGIVSGQGQHAQPVGGQPGILIGRKGNPQGFTRCARGRMDMPGIESAGIPRQLCRQPAFQLLSGQDREPVQVFRFPIISRPGSGPAETLPIKGNLPGCFHQLPDPAVLDLDHLPGIAGSDRIPDQGKIILHGVDVFHTGVIFIIAIRYAGDRRFTGQCPLCSSFFFFCLFCFPLFRGRRGLPAVLHDPAGLPDQGLPVQIRFSRSVLDQDLGQAGRCIGSHQLLGSGRLSFFRDHMSLQIIPQDPAAFVRKGHDPVLRRHLAEEFLLLRVPADPVEQGLYGKLLLTVQIIHEIRRQVIRVLCQDVIDGIIMQVEGLAIDIRQFRHLRDADVTVMVLLQDQRHKGAADIFFDLIKTSVTGSPVHKNLSSCQAYGTAVYQISGHIPGTG